VFHASQWDAQSDGMRIDSLAPGGNSIRATNAGDWVCYNQIDFGSGELTVLMAYVAVTVPGKTIQIRLDTPTGDIISTLKVVPTEETDIFKEQFASVTSVSGVHDIYLSFPEGPVGLDWFIFSSDPDNELAAQRETRMQWWREARFGAFIHWGAYSVLGRGEWVMYLEEWSKSNYESEAAATLNPVSFDAETWVRLFKQAGQKYVVITAKHHDGFSMYDTHVRDFEPAESASGAYSIVEFTGYRSDPLRALSAACKRHGIKFCVYYSILDWHHPSQQPIYDQSGLTDILPEWKERYVSEMKEQLRELIEQYDPAVLWFDGDWGERGWWWTESDGIALYRYLRVLKPDLIINERVKRDCGLGDFRSPEQTIPANGLPYDWETCMTMNGSWGYHETDKEWKSIKTLIQNLVDIASKGGNFLLNIGPKADGSIPQESADLLAAIGDWMKIYGESVYGTTASPFPETPDWGRYTIKPGWLYAHIFKWPADGQLSLPHIQNLNRVYLTDNPNVSLNYSLKDGRILIQLPNQAPNPYDSVVTFEILALDK